MKKLCKARAMTTLNLLALLQGAASSASERILTVPPDTADWDYDVDLWGDAVGHLQEALKLIEKSGRPNEEDYVIQVESQFLVGFVEGVNACTEWTASKAEATRYKMKEALSACKLLHLSKDCILLPFELND